MRIILLFWVFHSLLFSANIPPTPELPPQLIAKSVIKLYKGWNLVASPSNEAFPTAEITNVVGNDLYFFDSTEQAWKSGLGLFIQAGVGFWVNVSSNLSLSYSATPNNTFDLASFEVNPGWNLLGMSAETERVFYIASLHNAKAVYIYEAAKSAWKEYPAYSRSSLKAGMGFWLETK